MRIVVLGGTGHIGSYLVPRLVRAGHRLVVTSRGSREPYHPDPAWDEVERVVLDRDASDDAGTTATQVLDQRPDVVVDLICFTEESARQLVGGLRGRVALHAHCGTVWTHGNARVLPILEDDPKFPFGDYGVAKHAIEQLLIAETRADGLPSTVIHPGHISGPGWRVINPVGNLDPTVWSTVAAGDEVVVPGDGNGTMHHVHADDVAQLFERAIDRPEVSVGETFHAVSDRALTTRGYAEAAFGWWGHEPRVRPVSWDEFRAGTSPADADASWQHLSRSQVFSIDKSRSLLGYAPGWTSLEATREAVDWLARHDPDHPLPPLRA